MAQQHACARTSGRSNMITQQRPKRKASGGRYKFFASKKMKHIGRSPALTKLGEKKMQLVRVRAGAVKQRLLHGDVANVYDPKTKNFSKEKIKTILECPANANFVRRNIMVKGTVIDTEKGKAVITSRPGQDGVLNAVLV